MPGTPKDRIAYGMTSFPKVEASQRSPWNNLEGAPGEHLFGVPGTISIRAPVVARLASDGMVQVALRSGPQPKDTRYWAPRRRYHRRPHR